MTKRSDTKDMMKVNVDLVNLKNVIEWLVWSNKSCFSAMRCGGGHGANIIRRGGGECSLKKTSKGFIHQPTNHTPSLIFWGNKMIKEGNSMTKRKIVISNQNTKSFSYSMFFSFFLFSGTEFMWKSCFEHQRISPKIIFLFFLFPLFNFPVWKCENLVLSIKELVRNETKCKLVFPQARISYKRQSSTEQCWRGLNRLKNAKWNATEGPNIIEKSGGSGNSHLMPLKQESCCFCCYKKV